MDRIEPQARPTSVMPIRNTTRLRPKSMEIKPMPQWSGIVAWVARRPRRLAMAGRKNEIPKQPMLNSAKQSFPTSMPFSNPGDSGVGALKRMRAIARDRYCHISGSPYQVKNLTHQSCFMVGGISRRADANTHRTPPYMSLTLRVFPRSKAARSSGGYSLVVHIVQSTDASTATAPM